jgi:hypothetical protein
MRLSTRIDKIIDQHIDQAAASSFAIDIDNNLCFYEKYTCCAHDQYETCVDRCQQSFVTSDCIRIDKRRVENMILVLFRSLLFENVDRRSKTAIYTKTLATHTSRWLCTIDQYCRRRFRTVVNIDKDNRLVLNTFVKEFRN